jgi:hypothetical protein
MTKAQIFPAITILIDLGACVVYLWQRDVRRALYWLFAAAITATVTF